MVVLCTFAAAAAFADVMGNRHYMCIGLLGKGESVRHTVQSWDTLLLLLLAVVVAAAAGSESSYLVCDLRTKQLLAHIVQLVLVALRMA